MAPLQTSLPLSPPGMPASPVSTDEALDIVAGLVERVTFHNAETGFCVLRVKPDGLRQLLTVVGHTPAIEPGEWVEAAGSWVQDPRHGLQFRAESLRAALPGTREGVAKYLGSGMIPGIGPVHARRLVAAFGDDVFRMIEEEPERLQAVPGIGPLRARHILDAWSDQKVVREIMVFLHAHGIGAARAVRIYKTYGPDAIRLIHEDPYRLARDIRGIGFIGADAVALRLGVRRTAPGRVRSGVLYALSRATEEEGHCGVPRDELLGLAEALLEVPHEAVEHALAEEIAAGGAVADDIDGVDCIFPAALHRAERRVAERLRVLEVGPVPWGGVDPVKAVQQAEAEIGFRLGRDQCVALERAVASKLLVITGGPGVGKTTLVDALLRVLRGAGMNVLLAAPTGRAAKRLAEGTGIEARTLHRLLEIDPLSGQFRRHEGNPLDADLLVVDEASMIDVRLMSALLAAVPRRSALLLIGDVDQLPPVGPGQVLADVIGSGAVPVVCLRDVFRQTGRSEIVRAAHRVREGLLPLAPPVGVETDFYLVEAKGAEDIRRKLVHIVTERIPRRFGLDPVRDVQVLCPMHRGPVGARLLNAELQRLLTPLADPHIRRFGSVFCLGDKVMQVENDYAKDVYNGDLGRIVDIDPPSGRLTLEFDGREVTYFAGELDRIQLAYATTVHKAQGCEFPAVVVPISTQHGPMLHRNLLYTALTRGQRLAVLVGEPAALERAVTGVHGLARWTLLRQRLAFG